MATPTTLPAAFVSGAILTADQMNNLRGAFRVLQVVTSTATANIQNNTSTYVNTGLSVTITPTSNTSKILIFGSHAGLAKNNTNLNAASSTKLVRGSTDILLISQGILYTATNVYQVQSESFNFLDSPATTSATTYKTMFNSVNNNDGIIVQINIGGGNPTSTITAMEISA
jgi:cell division protein FtsL